jgi:hypothetical protein
MAAMPAMGGGVARLENGILDEAQTRLLRLGHPQLILGDDMDVLGGEQGIDLAHLARVVAGQDDGLPMMGLEHCGLLRLNLNLGQTSPRL